MTQVNLEMLKQILIQRNNAILAKPPSRLSEGGFFGAGGSVETGC